MEEWCWETAVSGLYINNSQKLYRVQISPAISWVMGRDEFNFLTRLSKKTKTNRLTKSKQNGIKQ